MVSGSRMTSTQLAVCPFHLRELEGSGWANNTVDVCSPDLVADLKCNRRHLIRQSSELRTLF